MKKKNNQMPGENSRSSALVAAAKATNNAQIVINFFKYGSITLGLYFARDVLIAFAGRETNANVDLSLLANVNFAAGVGVMAGVGGIGYGMFQRRQRKITVGDMSDRVEDLEKKFDPRRSSSKLQKNGDTNPFDRN